MLRIRRVEEAIAQAYPAKEMRCPIHLSIGQEATAVGVCSHLQKEDHLYSNHRCHAHYLAKGGSLPKMIAELFGRVTGCCQGKGGSMHLSDPEAGMMGASALVGGTIPIAVGSALSFSLDRNALVSVVFLGDGATEEGVFFESLNFAALKKLPVIFACENNGYATYSAQYKRQATLNICDRARAFGMAHDQIDGNDVESVSVKSGLAIERARQGKGPILLELRTCRFRDHVGPEPDTHLGYREERELEQWRNRCPITRLEKQLLSGNTLTEAIRAQWLDEIDKEISQAFEFARASSFPGPKEVLTDVYAESPN